MKMKKIFCKIESILLFVCIAFILSNSILLIYSNDRIKKYEEERINDDKIINNYKNKYQYNKIDLTQGAVKIPIITFHRTVDSKIKKEYYENDDWVNDLSVTEKELNFLYENGWKTITLDQFYCWYNKDCTFPIKTFVITIDDGDSEAYYNLLPIFEKYNFSATLFAIGSKIPDKTELFDGKKRTKLGLDKINQLRKSNSLLQVESHSYDMHRYINDKKAVQCMNYDEIVKDIEKNEKYSFNYFAYPYGESNDKIIKALSNSNIKLAFSFRNYDYATRADGKYKISRLKVGGNTTMKEFEKIFEYAD